MNQEDMEKLADMIAERLMDTFAARLDMIEEVVFDDSFEPVTAAPDIGPMDKEWTIGRAANAWGMNRSSIYEIIKRGAITPSTNGKGERVVTTAQMIDRYGYPENQQPAITVSSSGEANADAISFSKIKRGGSAKPRKDIF